MKPLHFVTVLLLIFQSLFVLIESSETKAHPSPKDTLVQKKNLKVNNILPVITGSSRYKIQYHNKSLLGEGFFGKIYTGTCTRANEDVERAAVKIIQYDENVVNFELVSNEVKILMSIQDFRFCTKFLSAIYNVESKIAYIAMSLEQFQFPSRRFLKSDDTYDFNKQTSDLFEYVSNNYLTRFTPEEIFKDFAQQILLGLFHLHDQLGICHLDLKPENILLSNTKDEDSLKSFKITLKIADFGLALRKDQLCIDGHYKFGGTPQYRSPEVWEHKPYNELSDIWSLGRIFLWIFTCLDEALLGYESRPPHPTKYLSLFNAKADKYGVSHNLQTFINDVLKPDFQSRPSASELLNHEFIMSSPQLYGKYECTEKSEISNSAELPVKKRKIK